MDNETILNKVLKKAEENGYKPIHIFMEEPHAFTIYQFYQMYIFSHDFAKAFWGEEEVCRFCGGKPFSDITCTGCDTDAIELTSLWQYHLQQMVLEEDPIKYLKEFL